MKPALPVLLAGAVVDTTRPAGWIFFDGDCGFCRALIGRWGPALRRHGYLPVPLQTPGTAERLSVTPEALRQRMHLLTADGRRYVGADAYIEMARSWWWARPFAWGAQIPGARAVLRRLYDWVAARRYCLGGSCEMRLRAPARPRKRTRPFLDLP